MAETANYIYIKTSESLIFETASHYIKIMHNLQENEEDSKLIVCLHKLNTLFYVLDNQLYSFNFH